MKVKFENADEFLIYLARTEKSFKKRNYPSESVLFLDLKFTSFASFFQFLEGNSIIQIENKPIVEWQLTNGLEKFKEYSYTLDSILLDTEILKLLSNDNYVNPKLTDRLLTIKEVCNILGVTKPSVYKLFKLGKLSYFEILSQKKVRLSDLNVFIEKSRKLYK